MRAVVQLVLATALLLAIQPAEARRSGFRTYSVEHGLAQSQVSAVVQDHDGYLWIGSYGAGLSRFDGQRFRVFSEADGLVGGIIRALAVGPDGTLWAGTDAGLSRKVGGRFESFELDDRNTAIRDLAFDEDGVLWIGTDRGALRYDGVSVQTVTLPLTGAVLVVWPEADGIVWFGAGRGLVRLTPRSTESYTTADGLPDGAVSALGRDTHGTLWIGTRAGLGSWDDGRILRHRPESGLASADVRAIRRTRDGVLWIATSGDGLCRIDADGGESWLGESDGLPSPTVWALAEDRESNLWVGTYRGGLARYSSRPFHAVARRNSLAHDTVRSFHQSEDGGVWVGTFRNGAFKLGADGRVVAALRDELADEFVIDVFEDSSGAAWFGTRRGLSRWREGRVRTWLADDGLPDQVIRDLLEDARGRVWVATNSGGIAILDGERLTRVGEAEGLTSPSVMKLAHGAAGIWIATLDGIFLHDGRTVIDASERYGWIRRDIYSIVERPDGALWIAAYGSGVFRCTMQRPGDDGAGACRRLSRRDGLPSDGVVSLVFDRRDHLWVGTEDGVARVDATAWVAGRAPRIDEFVGSEGLGSTECVHNAVLEDEHGRIWFGTVDGVYRHDSRTYRPNPIPPSIHIVDLRLPETDIALPASEQRETDGDWRRTASIPHGVGGLDIEFTGISLSAPERVRYRHRLLGFDDSWSTPTTRTAMQYRRLPPGSYTFEVEASNENGTWSSSPASYSFRIESPFWQRTWFIAIASLIALLGLVGLSRLRVAYLHRRNRLLEERVARGTRQLALQTERVEQLNAELELKVAGRTDELMRVNQQLRGEISRREQLENEMLRHSKLESLAVLAGGIAHDFNNLLMAILGNISLARDEFTRVGLDSDSLDQAERACLRSRDLTTQLLTFSRGGAPITRTLQIEPVLREAIGLGLRGSNVKARIEVEPDLANVTADEGQLSQVLGNLTLNAVQAMPRGGQIHVRCRNRSLPDDSESAVPLPAGQYVHLSIRDEGAGIDASIVQRVFDPYFTTKEAGHGLGLATVHSIVLRHEGWIDVESSIGQGSTFHVYLPATHQAAHVEPSDSTTRQPINARVLLMDDEPHVREIASKMLVSVGCSVEAVADGRLAIDRFNEARAGGVPFDLLVLDLTVPGGFGGLETIQAIRQIDPDACAVVSSGYSHDGALAEFKRHGFVDALSKPFTLDELERVIASATGPAETGEEDGRQT